MTEETKELRFDDLPLHEVEGQAPNRRGFRWRYWCVPLDDELGMNDLVGIYVVAVINEENGYPRSWWAAIGGSLSGAEKERTGFHHVASYGSKIDERIARVIWPEFDAIPWRD